MITTGLVINNPQYVISVLADENGNDPVSSDLHGLVEIS